MKILKFFMAGILLFTVVACSAEPSKIGVVDLARAVNESNQGKAANARLKTLIKAKQDELKQKENAIANLKKSIQTDSSAAAKKADEDKLAKAEADYEGLLTSSAAELKQKAEQLRTPLLQKLQKVIDAVGREGNYQVILATSSAVYFQKTIDVTDQVIKKFNASARASHQ